MDRSKNGGELDLIIEDIELCIIRNGSKLYSEEKARHWAKNGAKMAGALS